MKKIYNKPFALAGAMVMLGLALLTSCKQEFDYTVDTGNPQVVSYNPTSTVEGVAVSSNLILTFNENIKKGAGNIIITSKVDTQRISVTSDAVTIGDDKRILTINPTADLEADQVYTVTLERGIVTDLLGNEYMGLPDGTTWTFKTVGQSGLPLNALSPLPGSTDGSLFKLELTFAADVRKGAGNFSVYETNGNVKVAEISVAGQSVVVDGKRVTVKLGTPLKFATSYYVLADAGTIVDADGKAFEGFLTPTSWSFTTTAGNGTALIAYLPLDNDLTDASGNRFDAMPGEHSTASVTFVTDAERGRVASFGSGSYAVLPKHDMLRPALTQSFSFSLWVKFQGIGSDPALFSNSNWDSGGNPGFVFATDGADTYTGPGSSGRGWLVKLTGDAGGVSNRMDWRANETDPQSPAVGDNKWHMVTVVVDQATKLLHVYIDAKEHIQATKPASYDLNTLKGPLWDSVNDYAFTIWEDGSGVYNSGDDTRKTLSGLVDDVRIYNKALTATEVSALFVIK
ncbi:Ig-like domain-containing protein [Mucilaginibacter sp. JRF]|uniref:Ig-like domain-containing protein n=1 Tax=Mucilaginibacter sp. JRF TaxID=2780088 RepID=UPI001880DB84|nr:Ig-like domain-containing protein [Mucilaginibacter sp. JRF]MBE9586455.1 Ig-like domain-containing protein [Mucilaginibacter sp. JRF]